MFISDTRELIRHKTSEPNAALKRKPTFLKFQIFFLSVIVAVVVVVAVVAVVAVVVAVVAASTLVKQNWKKNLTRQKKSR